VVDTRLDRRAFLARHLRGSLCAPLDRQFPTIAGSYLEPEQELALIVAESRVGDAVRALVRIGLDRIAGWAPPEAFAELPSERIARIESIDFQSLLERSRRGDEVVVDVRGAADFATGHLPGALQIAHTRLASRAGELPAGRTLLVHCGVGERSAPAVSWLVRNGFPAIHVEGQFVAPSRESAATR
jgi:hydroxyacylglutathione hydrolase